MVGYDNENHCLGIGVGNIPTMTPILKLLTAVVASGLALSAVYIGSACCVSRDIPEAEEAALGYRDGSCKGCVEERPRIINSLVTDYDARINSTLRHLLEERVGPRDADLISVIRELIDPPSAGLLKVARRPRLTPQATVVNRLLRRVYLIIYIS